MSTTTTSLEPIKDQTQLYQNFLKMVEPDEELEQAIGDYRSWLKQLNYHRAQLTVVGVEIDRKRGALAEETSQSERWTLISQVRELEALSQKLPQIIADLEGQVANAQVAFLRQVRRVARDCYTKARAEHDAFGPNVKYLVREIDQYVNYLRAVQGKGGLARMYADNRELYDRVKAVELRMNVAHRLFQDIGFRLRGMGLQP